MNSIKHRLETQGLGRALLNLKYTNKIIIRTRYDKLPSIYFRAMNNLQRRLGQTLKEVTK